MTLAVAVMGVVNVTPDSFFPASRTAATDDAIERGRRHFADGADVVDVGGESTRPGATSVAAADELARVLPVVRALAGYGPVSLDTQKESVARAGVAAGATIINDVSASLFEVAGELGVGYVAMHRRGDAATMQVRPRYGDVVAEVGDFLRGLAERARAANVGELWLDPGIGFGKNVEHNLALLANVGQFAALAREYGAGLLVGTSRKRFLEHLGAGSLTVDDRLEGSLASAAWAMMEGAAMVRVHDVRATAQLRDLVARPYETVTT